MASKEELARWAATPGLRETEMGTPWTGTDSKISATGWGTPSGVNTGQPPNMNLTNWADVTKPTTTGMDWGAVQGWSEALPTSAVQVPQYDPFDSSTPHPGWNAGEAGPPGSPDFVRNPKTDADWQQRYYWFMQDEDHKKMLDPRWRPINAWYNATNPNAHAILGEVARGERDLWGWTPEGAQKQLAGWGITSPSTGGSSGGYSGGGGGYSKSWGGSSYTPNEIAPAANANTPVTVDLYGQQYSPGYGQTTKAPAVAGATLGGVKSPTWTDPYGTTWSGYPQNTPGGGGTSGVEGSLRPMKQVLTPAGPMWVPA